MAAPGVRAVLPVAGTRPLRPVTRAVVERGLVTVRTADVVAHLPRYFGHLRPGRVAHHLSIVRRLLDEQEYPLELGSIDCPVMFVWGDRDRLAMSSRNGQRLQHLARRAPDARNEVIAGCGHAPQLEAPVALLALIDSFSATTLRQTHLRPSASWQHRPTQR